MVYLPPLKWSMSTVTEWLGFSIFKIYLEMYAKKFLLRKKLLIFDLETLFEGDKWHF